MTYQHTFRRHATREVGVGNLVVGGDNPIWVQSMTTTDTHDFDATLAEIRRLEEAGCELIRVTVPKPRDAAVLSELKKHMKVPLICDIHFDYRMALAALDHPVDKIRINPGNIGGYDRYREVIRKCKDKGVPMRIGVNAGSLERELVEKYGFPCPPAMVESALRYIEIAESEGYRNPHRIFEVERCLHCCRSLSAICPAGQLPDAYWHHRSRQTSLLPSPSPPAVWEPCFSTGSATPSA
ncbi:MAG: hypothetical protein KatS3mg105_4829 [Gemmatales bacterium]|nr:MAG: hypothetical protein KatS3mg105_4829 [Gemmatales bacterium]